MKRAYFVADNLGEIENAEQDLESSGIPATQMRVLSEDEMAVKNHRLHSVPDFFQKDIIHQGTRGAIIGVILASTTLITVSLTGLNAIAGTAPVLVLAAFFLGFSTWVGGLIGMHQTNYKFRDLVKVVAKGRHVFMVDFSESQEVYIKNLTVKYPRLSEAGFGSTAINPFAEDEPHPVR